MPLPIDKKNIIKWKILESYPDMQTFEESESDIEKFRPNPDLIRDKLFLAGCGEEAFWMTLSIRFNSDWKNYWLMESLNFTYSLMFHQRENEKWELLDEYFFISSDAMSIFWSCPELFSKYDYQEEKGLDNFINIILEIIKEIQIEIDRRIKSITVQKEEYNEEVEVEKKEKEIEKNEEIEKEIKQAIKEYKKVKDWVLEEDDIYFLIKNKSLIEDGDAEFFKELEKRGIEYKIEDETNEEGVKYFMRDVTNYYSIKKNWKTEYFALSYTEVWDEWYSGSEELSFWYKRKEVKKYIYEK